MKKELGSNQSLATLCVCTPVGSCLCSSSFQTHSISAFRHASWGPRVSGSNSVWILLCNILLFREALQVLELLIFTCKSFFRVVIPKAHHRGSRLFKKQTDTVDKQRNPSGLGCPQCQAEPDSHSLCLSYATLCTPTLHPTVVCHCEHTLHCCPQTLICRAAVSPSYLHRAGWDS